MTSRKNAANAASSWTSLAIGSPGGLGELVEDRPALGDGRAKGRVVLRSRREEHGTGHLLEVPPGDVRVGVVGRDDLTLLGELEPAVD